MHTYYKYSYLQINDNILYTYPRFFSNKKLRVSDIGLQADGLVELTLQEYDPAAFVQVTQTDDSSLQITPVIAVRKPTDVQLSQTLGTVPGQQDATFILDWVASASEPVLHYEVNWTMTSTAGNQISTNFTVPTTQVISGSGRGYFLINGVNPQETGDVWTMTAQVRTVLATGAFSGWVIKEIDSSGSLYAEVLEDVTGFVVTNPVPGTVGQFFSSSIQLAWNNTVPGASYYEIVIFQPGVEGNEYGGFLVAGGIFTYTLALNMADYFAVNASNSAFRDVRFKIRARSNPALNPANPPASWGDAGASSNWTYLEA